MPEDFWVHWCLEKCALLKMTACTVDDDYNGNDNNDENEDT